MLFDNSTNGFGGFGRRYLVATTLWVMVTCGTMSSVLAAPGHDHGEDEEPVMSGTILPRFMATSEKYELVGVINGEHLTLYLDDTESNAPVVDALVRLVIGTEEVEVEQHEPGEFEAVLSSVPGVGVVPVTVRITTPHGNGVLSGELDIHEAEASESAGNSPDQRGVMPWGILGGVAFAGFAAGLACSGLGRRFVGGKQSGTDIGGAA